MAGKGQPKTGGRQKGTPNKLSGDVKAMVLAALDEAGGVAYLLQQSESNASAFLSLVGKVLPLTVAGDPNAPLVSGITVNLVKPDRTDP
jgi:hypothetical protein